MGQGQFVEILLASRDRRSRSKLFRQPGARIDAALAGRLMDVCVENWAAQPKLSRRASKILFEISATSRDPQIKPYSLWAHGIAEMTRGRLESAVDSLTRATSLFSKLGLDYESAQPQIATLVALAMLGRYDRISRIAPRALKILEEFGDELSAGKIEINLSNISSRRGRHRDAEKLGLSAYKRFHKIRARSWQAMAENGLAITYTELSDFQTAKKWFQAALKSAIVTGAHVTEAEIEASIGNLEFFRGRYGEALRSLERSRKKFDSLGLTHKAAVTSLELAEIYAELNLTQEADDIFTSVLRKLTKAGMTSEEARARVGLGRLAARNRDPKRARDQLRRALGIYEKHKDDSGIASAVLDLASLELAAGNWAEALRLGKSARTKFEKIENKRDALACSWIVERANQRTSKTRDSVTRYRRIASDALKLENTPVALLSLNSAGRSYLERGDMRAARSTFTRAVSLIEKSRGALIGEEFQVPFLEGKLEPYEQLVRMSIMDDDLEDAFQYQERARSRSLDGTGGRESFRDGSSEARNAEKLRERLNWAYKRLRESAGSGARKIGSEIKRLEREFSQLMLRKSSLGGVSRGRGRDAVTGWIDLNELRSRLGKRRALVEYISYQGKFSAFVLTSDRIGFFEDLTTEAAVSGLLEELRFQFASFRYGRGFVGRFEAQLKQRADSILVSLHRMLLKPLIGLVGSRDVVIAPTGALHYVPFNSLTDGLTYLVETRTVSVTPSAAIWLGIRKRANPSLNKPLLIGFADEAAPMVEEEITEISQFFPKASVFTGSAATFANFEANVRTGQVLHLACHGQFRADNPLYSNLRIADGQITVRDIASKALDGSVLVLSACETGVSKVFPGNELVGLARGCILAGAGAVLLSLWTVNDETTKRLMVDLYMNLNAGNTFEDSLRLAQSRFATNGEHPYYWSPFFCIA